MSPSATLLADVGVGAVAGLVASKISEYVQELLYRATPQSVRLAEEQVRSGDPSQVAARKLAKSIGVPAADRRSKAAATIHLGLGAAWGPVYCLLRRHSGMNPPGAALVTGATMSLIVDEAMTPAMGFSAPSRAYPTLTHARGFAAHLLFGAAVGVAAETLMRLTGSARATE